MTRSMVLMLAVALSMDGFIDAAETRPNVVLILADDFGRELLSAYGGKSYDTPHLDRLSQSGMTFETCYATPLCSPSRVELMTSQYSFRSYSTWGEIDRDADTFVRRIHAAGYQTFMAGKWHMSGWDEQPKGVTAAGFDRHCSYDYAQVLEDSKSNGGNQYWGGRIYRDGHPDRLQGYGGDDFTNFLCDAIQQRDEARPFFAYLGLNLLHRPFFPTPDHANAPAVNESPPAEWLGPVGSADNFPSMVVYVDKLVGRIINTLEQAGLSDNTIVIFTSDNGTDNVHEAKTVRSSYLDREVAGGKYFPTELGLNVPLIVKWPGVVNENIRTTALCDFTDIGATICDVANVAPPTATDGQSLARLLAGDTQTHKPFIYSWGNYERSSRRYKDPANNLERIFDVIRGPRWKWISKGKLYDLDADWFEESAVPVSDSREIRNELKQRRDELRATQPILW